ncbi:MAG TPA: RluA family pseudouridine synthase [Tissierellales bacterium]|nr:RluA family pseudouridine synthase [Tissierellales bacterium]
MKSIEIYVSEDSGKRIDVYLAKIMEDESRTYIKGLINNGYIKVNGKIVKPKYLVKLKDFITVNFPEPEIIQIKPEDISLDIVYEDDNIAIINKPQGLLVHPANGNYSETLVNGLFYYFNHLSNYGGIMRPGIVHRLDKDTSGLLIIAKDNYCHERLSKELKYRNVKRIYWALVYGNIEQDKSTIKNYLGRDSSDRRKMTVVEKGGKLAITHYEVLERYKDYTLLEIELETGRTHQIRVHMASIGHPIVGDMTYSNRENPFRLKGQLLHAKEIGFIHPIKNCYLEFTSDLPYYFQKVLKSIRGKGR